MKTTRINGMNETIYIGDTYADCLRGALKDMFWEKENERVVMLSHFADLKVQDPNRYITNQWHEFIYDSKKEFIRDRYTRHLESRKDYLKDIKKAHKEPKDKVDIIKTTITEEVVENWCKDTINNETKGIWMSDVIIYSNKSKHYRAYRIDRQCPRELDTNKDAKFVAISVSCKHF